MRFEPMLKKQLDNYAKLYSKEGLSESKLYQNFVDYTVLKSFQPATFFASNNICELSDVDGKDDMGIDAIAICVNGVLVSSISEIQSIIAETGTFTAKFIFIQCKYQDKIDSKEYGAFVDGIEDFLSTKHNEPRNEDVNNWLAIKDWIFEEGLQSLGENPDVAFYFASPADYGNDIHVQAKNKSLIDHIHNMKSYNNVESFFLNDEKLLNLCNENENNFSVTLDNVQILQIDKVNGVSSAEIVMCSANEIIKMMTSSDGQMRKSLFDDNVRDYQGNTGINSEIQETLKVQPEYFVLMNNGITITCSSENTSSRKTVIKNPHIVNGCQTCCTLFYAAKEGINVENISLIIKIVATENEDITNQIVRATNRQNIVYDEAFETTKEFHKRLESFFGAMPRKTEFNHRLFYYERRAKQYSNNSAITNMNKVNFRILIQSFVSLFLHKPHDGLLHQSILLKKYNDKIFIDKQSFYPYYIASCLELTLENAYKLRNDRKFCMTYKNQLLFIFSIIAAGFSPDINSPNIDDYCKKLEKYLEETSKDELENTIEKSISVFKQLSSDWIAEKGYSYRYALKDNQEFTEYIKKNTGKIIKTASKNNNFPKRNYGFYRGTVIKTAQDVHNKFYGFISTKYRRIFFHSADNPGVDFSDLAGKDVLYKMQHHRNGQDQAIIKKVLL